MMNKTNNYQLSLMLKGQVNKDITYNESILTLDNWLNTCIIDLVAECPSSIGVNEKYIITTGERRGQICFKRQENKKMEFLKPFNGMIFYVLRQKCFFIFNGESWQIVEDKNEFAYSASDSKEARDTEATPQRFVSSGASYELGEGKDTHYIYLTDNTELTIATNAPNKITLIIKQNYEQSFSLSWHQSILWPSGGSHQMSEQENTIDIICLQKLAETENYLACIIGSNYQW